MSENIKHLAMRRVDPTVTFDGIKAKITLPEGASGIMLVFDSAESCRKYFGDDIETIEIELRSKK